MDFESWLSKQESESAANSGDWKSQLKPESRERVVNKIADDLKKYFPDSHEPEAVEYINTLAARFEEKMFSTATDLVDYMRKIAVKMLDLKAKSKKKLI